MPQSPDTYVFIGRFQPPHLGHFALMREALTRAGRLIVLCGAAGSARRLRNPWRVAEREAMIRAGLTAEENARVQIGSVADYPDDNDWVAAVRAEVARLAGDHARIALFGHIKDETSYYLALFPDWGLVSVPSAGDYNATAIRKAYFRHDATAPFRHPWLPEGVATWLQAFRASDDFAWLLAEQDSIQASKALWKDAPYPVIFVTTDAAVFHRGHVLLVRRKHHPGKGLWALPGGFLDADETLFASCLRELRKETGWDFQEAADCLVASTVYDKPTRSDRGRTITHAFAFRLPDAQERPQISGQDDAETAQWWPLDQLRREECFEDHHAIITAAWEKIAGK
ncbi:MAG: bifunctional nicotinamide-nucleotide adenylyltransferase/Nudix hydroxylase [Cardiobacteriaceae bacterium]|nr:bifunctional nicotinamide-nucleotide adenylyltransferase/Nudix hydroxylase [Cardiobacteriaceae bacterium]